MDIIEHREFKSLVIEIYFEPHIVDAWIGAEAIFTLGELLYFLRQSTGSNMDVPLIGFVHLTDV